MIKMFSAAFAVVLMLCLLFLPWPVSAATDGIYQLTEVTQTWDGTDGNRTKPPTIDYDYTYGDESNLSYTLPWSFNFYGQAYNQVNVDTNGNVWFGATGSAHSFNLKNTGRGPVVAAWNNDLSSYYYGGVFIQHKTDPERVVFEWQTETYSEEGFSRPNNFEVVVFPNGTARIDYKSFSAIDAYDFGSGVSNSNGTNSLNISSLYGNVFSLAGRSFQILETAHPAIIVAPFTTPTNISSQTISGSIRGITNNTTVTVASDSPAVIGTVTYPTATTWSVPVFGLAEGVNNISVTATDDSGNNVTTTVPLTFDTVAPTVHISSPVGMSGRSPQLSYTVSDGAVTVKVDGVTVPKVSGQYLDLPSDGPHTVRVEAVDLAGNVGFDEASFFSESIPPVVTLTSPSGVTSRTPLLSYTISEGIAVVMVDGNVISTPSGVNLSPLSDGRHSLRVVATNTVGQTTTQETAFIVDSKPPFLIAPVAQVALSNHGLAIQKGGSLWAWGANTTGQLGDGSTFDRSVPEAIGNGGWGQVAAGYSHTAALKTDGSLWTWGSDGFGELGTGTVGPDIAFPTRIGDDINWSAVAAGDGFTIALKKDGTLWAWGDNGIGELGDGTTDSKANPRQVNSDNNWAAIATGSIHTLALKSDGTLFGWGDNTFGQLRTTFSDYSPDIVQLGTDSDWVAITAGSTFSVALKRDGTLWAWGNNENGQLGRGGRGYRSEPAPVGNDSDWTAVSAGESHVLAVKADGTLWAWGDNSNGQLGIGDYRSKNAPVQVGTDSSWKSVAAGGNSSTGVKSDGSLWAWGYNRNGELGLGTTDDESLPALVTLEGGDNLLIDQGAAVTNTRDVLLSYRVVDSNAVTAMQFSNDSVTWSAAEAYAISKYWTLSEGAGLKSVYARFSDQSGNWSGNYSASIVLDDQWVGDGPELTVNPVITPTVMRKQTISGTTSVGANVTVVAMTEAIVGPVRFSTPSTWSCSLTQLANGANPFLVVASDVAGNTTLKPIQVVYDSTRSWGAVTINNGARFTSSSQVQLSVKATDSRTIMEMQFSNDGITWTDPEPYTVIKPWTLASDEGPKQLYARLMDSSGNWSVEATATIIVNTNPPITANTIFTVAGGGTGDGNPSLEAILNDAEFVKVDSSGNIYIADSGQNRIRKVDVFTGIISTIAGKDVSGYDGDNGPATAARLNYPAGIALDGSGNIFIADSGNNVIRKVDGNGVITTVAGNGMPGYAGDGGPATLATLSDPSGIALDSAGSLLIADSGNSVIRKVDLATGVITSIAGNGTYGNSGDHGPATSASLSYPYDIATDVEGNLVISDSDNNLIRRVNAGTGTIATIAGNGNCSYSGDGGAAIEAALASPRGIVFDGSGNLLVADTYNNVIRKVDRASGIITTISGKGDWGYSGDGGIAKHAALNGPVGIALDLTGNFFIADAGNGVIRKVDFSTGIISTVAGKPGFLGDGGPAILASLHPYSVVTDNTGSIYIADADNNVVRKVAAITGIIATVAGNGVYGNTGDGGPAILASLAVPSGIALDSGGNIYIADKENNVIRRVDAVSGVITAVAGNSSFEYSGDNGPALSAGVPSPASVALDAAGNLYIVDPQNNVVRKVDTRGVITTVAGTGSYGYSGDGGSAISATLANPNGIAVDGAGNIFIADSGNNVIRMVSAATGIITRAAGNGSRGYSGDGGAATAASLSYPTGITVDGKDNLYIAENNTVVRKVDAATGLITTVAGNGTPGFSGDGGTAILAELNYPLGVAVDVAGNLFIADTYNGRVREVLGTSLPIADVTPPLPAVGPATLPVGVLGGP